MKRDRTEPDNDRQPISRRDFLQLTAAAAGGAVLAACGGAKPAARGTRAPRSQGTVAAPPTAGGAPTRAPDTIRTVSTPTAAPTSFKESPALAAQVKARGLPPLTERLPSKPYVVPHGWSRPGRYGGHMRMACSDEWGTAHFLQEFMYGHSPTRWLDDGLSIGPGLAESWEVNADATEWTLHFREGLKWSDGKPWTTEDILYWYEDMVLDQEHPEVASDDVLSGRGTPAKMKAADESTLVMTFDEPAPLVVDRMTTWVNGGIGPAWMRPKHYLRRFHPRYNPKLKGKKNWYEQHDQKMDFAINSDCPTMTGWKLKSYKEGVQSVWERNPYYYAVTENGDQLPYIDGVTMSYVQSPEVLKLRFYKGLVDYVHGPFAALALSDVSGLKEAEATSGLKVRFWDSGTGAGSAFWFNYDYYEPKMRELIRNPKFRKALSLAFNRPRVRKVVYFNTGEPTTGTMSPKAIEFNFSDEGKKVYRSWRDSYVKYDPEAAKKLLDEIGVKDTNGDGMREMPDGSKLEALLEYPANASQEHIQKDELLTRDWKAIGIRARMNPLPPESFPDRWHAGRVMSHAAWTASDGPALTLYASNFVPANLDHWAPLHSAFYLEYRGTPKENAERNKDPWKRTPPRVDAEPGGPIDRIWKIWDRAKVEPEAIKRHRLMWDIVKIHIDDGPFFMGSVANPPYIILVHQDMRNVPQKGDLKLGGYAEPWIHPTPAVYDPEAYYWENPEAHS